MNPRNSYRLGKAAAVLVCLVSIGVTLHWTSTARAQDALENNREVSYLVFYRSVGFDSPIVKPDWLDGSILVQFRRLPANWATVLAPQITSTRKQRFFKSVEAVEENGALVGLRIRLGIGSFTVRLYTKKRPARWVMRVGDSVTPPLHRGPWSVPIVPYADMVDEETPGRRALANAELEFAKGAVDSACSTFRHLRMTSPEIAPWAAIREADCMVEQNHSAMARELLEIVASQGKSDTLQLLARLRLTEISGSALRGPFFKSLYTLTREQRIRLGTIADEVDFRAARTHLFRGNPVKALNLLEEMLAKRPQSPFFHERTILKALRWRAIHTTVREKRWLTAAKTYLRIPPMPRNDPHWVEIHMLGSRALIEVGLPQRAILVSLHLLRQGGDEIDETQILIDLAMAYSEAGDHYRSELTLSYLTENYPGLRKNRDVLRLKGMLSLKKGDLQNATRIATLLTKNPSKINSQDARLTIASALKSMKSEGLHAARGLINAALTAGHELTMEVADDLAMAASDCQHLEKSANPVELASGVQLLWAASCLSRVGRLDDALVYLQAAHAYRAADLSDEQLWPLIQMVGESIQWWSTYKERVSPEDDEDTNLEKPLDGSGVLNGSEASS